MRLVRSAVLAVSAAACVAVSAAAFSQEAPQPDPAEMMKKWAEYTRPTPQHEVLGRFVGTFDTVVSVRMAPGAPFTKSKGEAVGAWIFGKRFVELRSKGSMMGMPVESLVIHGYDSFRKRYVGTALNSMEVAQRQFEGGLDPKTGAIHTYGKVDEYLDGTIAKNARCTWRFPDADTFVQEVHDLDIGEGDTKVFEITFTRRK